MTETDAGALVEDMPDGVLGLAAALVAIPSVSHDEGLVADAVEGALRLCPWLSVERVGDNVVARTEQGRPTRVLVAGHLDTVPPVAGNEDPRVEDGILYGVGAADMKGGLAVMLHLAGSLPEPAVDVSWCFYVCEEVAPRHNGLRRLWRDRPDLVTADAGILCEPTGCAVEAGCQGTMRVRLDLAGRRAHTARPAAGRNAIHRLAPVLGACAGYESRRVVIDGCEYAEQVQAVEVSGGVARNVVPDSASVAVNHRFAPDRSGEQAEDVLRHLLAPDGFEPGDRWEVEEASPGAPPVTRPSGIGTSGEGDRSGTPGQAGLDGRRHLLGPRRPRRQLRPRRSVAGPHPGRARRNRRAGEGIGDVDRAAVLTAASGTHLRGGLCSWRTVRAERSDQSRRRTVTTLP